MTTYTDVVEPTDELVISFMHAATINKAVVCISGYQSDGRSTCIMLDRDAAKKLAAQLNDFVDHN